MLMTRKDYRVIANSLRATRPDDYHGRGLWKFIVEDLANELRKANPNFQVGTFIEACNK